jgi:hypothetical protein
MFGYAAFAQPTFAGLGGSSYAVDILEALTLADNQDGIRVLNAAISESIITVSDIESIIATFSSAITEAITVADSPIAGSVFNISVSESITLADSISVIKTIYGDVSEPITLLNTQGNTGWFKIVDDQTVTWVAINNVQGSGWTQIDNSETIIWTQVNNIQ